MNALSVSDAGLQGLRDSEGLRLFAYPDPRSDLARATPRVKWGFEHAPALLAGLPHSIQILSGSPWTIGYGLTTHVDGRRVIAADTCTKEEAEAWLRVVAGLFADVVLRAVKVPINQQMLDALVNLAYNIGAHAFRQSTLVRLLNEGRYIEAQAEFDRWVHSGGKVDKVLVRRRDEEQEWFNHGIRSALADQPELLAEFNAYVEGTA